MKEIIQKIVLAALCLTAGVIKAKESVQLQSKPIAVQSYSKQSELSDKNSTKLKNILDQIHIEELERAVQQVAQKYRTQLSNPKDMKVFINTLQKAQEEIMNTYQSKYKL